MKTHDDPFLAIDRAHELQGEADDAFDAQLAVETKRQAAAIRTNVITGHEQTLSTVTESLCHKLAGHQVTETLVRTVLSCGPLTAGQMLLKLIEGCIDLDAETAALVEMERGARELAGGLDMAAMRAVAPQDVVVPQ